METLRRTVDAIAPLDQRARDEAEAHLQQLTMPRWALGRLMDLCLDLAGITASARPETARKAVVVMAGDHGVVAEGVSAYPAAVTPQMVANIASGGAGINALAGQASAEVVVVDMGVDADLGELVAAGNVVDQKVARGTRNLLREPAMTREQAVRAVEAGIDVATRLAGRIDVLGTGEMGIGNTTASSAIIAALCDRPVREVTGRGTGVDDEALAHKIAVIEQALARHRPDRSDGIDVLAKVGGFEIGGLAGLCLGAAAQRKPVVVDGLIATAGALIAQSLVPRVADYLIAAHRSVERGHAAALEQLGKVPLLDLGLRLGEGTGAALAMNLVEAARRIMTEVATFEQAAVSNRQS